MVCDDVDDDFSADRGDPRRPDRADGMVQGLEQEYMQVEEIAGDQKGQDLPPPIREEAITEGHAVCDHKGRSLRVALTRR